MNHWSLPENVTRTGASHIRRGVVCQDASGRQVLTDRSGQPVQVLVVADGHGGQRYTHSEVGSRLACELALQLLADQFSQWSSTKEVEIERWRRWLVETFSNRLHQRWLASIERHWLQEIPSKDVRVQPFSPIAYGTTLGVVIMTPTWWAHTGLGDWDLVRVGSAGDVSLVNEEQDEIQNSGEATCSLCLSNAPSHFAVRSAVYPISETTQGFSLLLSTDGVRKSCSTDNDFLAIAKYLCEGDQPRVKEAIQELNADLDRISTQGSGDDVSVAIGRWLGSDQSMGQRSVKNRHQRPQLSRPIIVQPRAVNPDSSSRNIDVLDDSISIPTSFKKLSLKQPDRHRKVLWFTTCLVLMFGAGLAVFSFLRGGGNGVGTEGLNVELMPELVAVLRREGDALCLPLNDLNQRMISSGRGNNNGRRGTRAGFPQDSLRSRPSSTNNSDSDAMTNGPIFNSSIKATLAQRKSIFQGLLTKQKNPNFYLSNPSQDPLSALIAWSYVIRNLGQFSDTLKVENRFLSYILTVIPGLLGRPEVSPSQVQSLAFCRDLHQGLETRWERAELARAAVLNEGLADASAAKDSIKELYLALSNKNFDAARLMFKATAEDQFDSAFFDQFKNVSVEDLEVIAMSGAMIDIEGKVVLSWPDGSVQVEKRIFTLDVLNNPPLVVKSEFDVVVSPRILLE